MRRKPVLVAALLLVALALGLAGLLYTAAFRSWLEAELGRRASQALGRRVEARVERFRPHALELALAELRVAGDAPQGAPLLAAQSLRAEGSWAALLRGRLEIARLRIAGARLDLTATSPPDPAGEPAAVTGWALGPARIRDLEITGSSVRFAGADVPVALLADDLELRARWRQEEEGYRGTARASAGRIELPALGVVPISLSLDFSLSESALALRGARASAPGLELTGDGVYRPGATTPLEADVEWVADLADLPLPWPAQAGARGSAGGVAWIRSTGTAITAGMRLEAPAMEIASLPIESVAGRLDWQEGELRLSDLAARVAGLDVRAEGALGLPEKALRAELSFRGDEIAPLLELAGVPRPQVAGTLTGRLSVNGTATGWQELAGRFGIQLADLRPLAHSSPGFRLEARGGLEGGLVEAESVELSGPGIALRGAGRWRPAGLSEVEGSASVTSWDEAARLLRALGVESDASRADRLSEIVGALEADFELSAPLKRKLDPRRLRASLDLRGRGLAWRGRPDYRLSGGAQLRLDRGEPRLLGARLQAPGWSLVVQGPSAPGRPYELALEADDIAPTAATLGAWVGQRAADSEESSPEWWRAAASRLRGAVSATGTLSGWRREMPLEELTGALELVARDVGWGAGESAGLTGSLSSTLAGGRLTLERLLATAAGLELEAAGRFDRQRADELTVRLTGSSLAASFEQARPLLLELGVDPEALSRLAGVSGRLTSEVRAAGPWLAPRANGSLTVSGLEIAGRDMGDLLAEVDADGERLSFAGHLGPPGRQVAVDGSVELSGERRARLRGRVDRQQLAPFADLAGLGDRLSGEVEAEVELSWPDRRSSGRLSLAGATIAGVAVERLETEWSGGPDLLQVSRGEVRAAGGSLSFGGRLGSAGRDEIGFSGVGLRLADLAATAGLPIDVEGSLEVRGRVSGTLDEPRLEATVATRETSLVERRTPDLAGPVTLDRSGLTVALASADAAASVSWTMGFAAGEPWSGALEYPVRLALDSWLSGDPAAAESIVEGVLRGDLQMPGGRPDLAVGRVRLDDARLTAAGYPLRIEGDVQAVLDPEVARLLPLRLLGEGTALTIAAELRRGAVPGLVLEVDGLLDLRALQSLSPGLTASGTASLDFEAGGPWPDFDWKGAVTLSDGAMRHPGFPAALHGLTAKISLAADDWILEELGGRLGGGSVSAQGRLGMAGFQPGDFRFEIDGVGVRLDYPEGFRSQFDATLAVGRSGDEAIRLSGQVALLRGLYDQDLGIERSILARRRALESAAEIERDWTDTLDLELDLRATEGLWVRNDLASLETRGELRVRGTLGRPRVSGRVEALEGGRIFFREVSYYVTQGAFDWVGGPIEDPRISVQAETSVGEYDVTLTVSGRLSEPVFELTSRPSLPTTDIVALLVTGATRDQFAAAEGGLTQAQAAAYLSSGLTSRLEASLRRSLGLDEIKLDPVMVEGQTNPTARVTVGKAISPRLSATYSTRLGTAQKDVYQARFRLRESLDLVGTRDDDGSLSADLRYNARQRRQAPASGGPGGSTGPRPVIREIAIRGGGVAGHDRLRRLLDLRTGEEFRKSRLLDGLDRIRGWYLERRYPEVDTVHRVVGEEGEVKLEIEVDEGPEVRFRFVGFEPGRRLERPLLELWQRSLFRDEIMSDVAAKVTDILARDGYVSARAEGALVPPAPGRVEAVVSIEPGPRVRVTKVALEGHESLDERRIREQILTRPSGWKARWLDPVLVAEDAEAIRALYVSSGFLAATVSPRIERPPPGGRAAVTYVIREGGRYRLRSARFAGNRQVPTGDLEDAAGLAPGEPFRDETARGLRQSVEALYDERGFPDARIEIDASPDSAEGAVDLVVSIEEGAQRRVEAVEIVNPGITRESVVRREIDLAAGDPVRRSAIEGTQFRLYRTGLFRSVRVDRLPGEAAGSERLRVALEEARNLRVHYGVGFDSEEGPRVTANVAHNNVDGGRLHLGVGGRWSPVDQRFQLLLRNPSMGGARAVGLLSAFWEAEERENFNVTRVGFSLDLGQRYRDGRISVNFGYDLADLDEEQTAAPTAALPTGGGTMRLAGVRLGVARSTRDSSFWPTTGSHARAEAALFHSALGSEADFARFFAQWNRYRDLPGDWLWSMGVRAGIEQSLGASTEIPFSERLFAGGETSLRGFARDSVVASGTPPELASSLLRGQSLGGEVLLVLNQELMVPLWEPVHGVLFYDVGNLYWRPADFDPTHLRHSVGLGLRLQSPFGPIRLEYGWKADRREGESAGQGHFSLGLAF